jgi:acyl-CoA synthetase (NDP forming)
MNIASPADLDQDRFWRCLFNADCIAVIGANNTIGSWGFDVMKAALVSTQANSRKRVFPVNPSLQEIQGHTAYNTVLDIPGPVELAIIVVRAELVPAIFRQCVQKKVPAALVISGGFAEAGAQGAKLQNELVEIARAGNLRFTGPNCVGHADIHTQVASVSIVTRVKPGPMALVTQSGTLGASILRMAASNGIGISKFISTGNEADLHLEDYLEFLAKDNDTHLIAAYIEGLREGRRFFELTREITTHKPVVVIKTGTTDISSQAAKSHTGALAGSDVVYSAAFKQAGVIRVDDEDELCDMAIALLNMPLPRGNRVGILTIGGGFGVVMAEACEKEGLKIAALEPQTLEKMNAILPDRWSHSNPVDMAGIRSLVSDPTVRTCLRLLMEDRNIDTLITLFPPLMVPPEMVANASPEQLQALRAQFKKHIDELKQMVKQYEKPLVVLRLFFDQPGSVPAMSLTSPEDRIPEYSSSRRVARMLRHLVWYRQYLEYRRGLNPGRK